MGYFNRHCCRIWDVGSGGRIVTERKFGWLGAALFFAAGCVLTFLVFQFSQRMRASASRGQQTNEKVWRFETSFKIPASVVINSPTKEQILSFNIDKPQNFFLPLSVTIKNLTEHPYAMTYEIFAYDPQNQRVDETSDSVSIESKETVLRKVAFSHVMSNGRPYVPFRLNADIEH